MRLVQRRKVKAAAVTDELIRRGSRILVTVAHSPLSLSLSLFVSSLQHSGLAVSFFPSFFTHTGKTPSKWKSSRGHLLALTSSLWCNPLRCARSEQMSNSLHPAPPPYCHRHLLFHPHLSPFQPFKAQKLSLSFQLYHFKVAAYKRAVQNAIITMQLAWKRILIFLNNEREFYLMISPVKKQFIWFAAHR